MLRAASRYEMQMLKISRRVASAARDADKMLHIQVRQSQEVSGKEYKFVSSRVTTNKEMVRTTENMHELIVCPDDGPVAICNGNGTTIVIMASIMNGKTYADILDVTNVPIETIIDRMDFS